MPIAGGGPNYAFKKVMMFIDGGYLRRKIHDLTNDEKFNLVEFPRRICDHFVRGLFKGDIIRVYYYDCQYDKDDPNFKDESNPKYNERIEKYDAYKGKFDGFRSIRDVEVKLGQLVVSSKEDKQKGADVLIAIDMITKAYENQYDIAILFAGDRDFLPLIKTVKESTGKKVYGVAFEGCPDDLRLACDGILLFSDHNLGALRLENWRGRL